MVMSGVQEQGHQAPVLQEQVVLMVHQVPPEFLVPMAPVVPQAPVVFLGLMVPQDHRVPQDGVLQVQVDQVAHLGKLALPVPLVLRA